MAFFKETFAMIFVVLGTTLDTAGNGRPKHKTFLEAIPKV